MWCMRRCRLTALWKGERRVWRAAVSTEGAEPPSESPTPAAVESNTSHSLHESSGRLSAEEQEGNNPPAPDMVQTSPAPAKKFGKRKKFAVLLSYSGRGYMGMQKNPGIPTIEEDLLTAMCKARAFPWYMKDDFSKLRFQRCARTDKGVSAAHQLVSLKMVELEDPVALINAHLPAQIRVMAVKRVTQGFDSRQYCCSRMYEYLMPTYAFAPPHQTNPDYRITESRVELVNELLALYVGTRNYHNFTAGKKFFETSARRFISSFKTGAKFLGGSMHGPGEKELEFISLKVKGQSFVLHQIRKMIGYVIAVVRGRLERAEFEKAFWKEKVDTPKAPALGLLLDNVYFDQYNAKFCNSGERERLEWEDLDPTITEFKKRYIYQTIIDTELREMNMMHWLRKLQMHDFYATQRWLAAESESAAFVTGPGSQLTGLHNCFPNPRDTAHHVNDAMETDPHSNPNMSNGSQQSSPHSTGHSSTSENH